MIDVILIVISVIVFAYWIVADAIRWYYTVKHFGFPKINSILFMWNIDTMRQNTIDSKHRASIYTLFVVRTTCGLIFITAGFLLDSHGLPSVGVFCVYFVASRAFTHIGMPPAILLLGASDGRTVGLHEQLVRRTFGLYKIVSLVYNESYTNIRNPLYFGSLRTISDNSWLGIVKHLMTMSNIIVMDLSISTQAVRYEVDMIIDMNLSSKCFVVAYNNTDDLPENLRQRTLTADKLVDMISQKYGPFLGTLAAPPVNR